MKQIYRKTGYISEGSVEASRLSMLLQTPRTRLNKNINVDTLVKVCLTLDCEIGDIMEILPEQEG
jgi:DNA-binding Xre family transcriptional regulator